MTKEQLLIPRVMCVGGKEGERNYPGSQFKTGEILTREKRYSDVYLTDNGRSYIFCFLADKFPHLFRAMPWWEGRQPEDMPLFVRNKTSIPVAFIKVDEWVNDEKGGWDFREGGRWHQHVWAVEPATLEEYEDYQKRRGDDL